MHVDPYNVERCVAMESFTPCAPSDHSDDEPEETLAVAESLFLQNITLFYLKLKAKLPACCYNTDYY